MVTILIAVLALLVALVALLRDTREHRRNRTADVQALMFQSNRSGVVTHINGDRGLRKFEPSVHASGFGTRYDVRTYLWVDDQVEPKWKDLSQSADRFDNTSEPLRCEIEVYDDDSGRVWFGIGHNESQVRGLFARDLVRSEFVRSNLVEPNVQVWQWYRLSSARKWWQRQTRFKFGGGGVPKPLGRWKVVSTDRTRPEQFPTWDGVSRDS